MSLKEFNAVIQKLPDMDAAFIELPFDAEQVFGKKRVKVKAWFDGKLYRGTLMRMGRNCDWLGITQEIRKNIRKNPGDSVHVVIEEDKEERTIAIPEDLAELLRKNESESDYFHSLAFTHRKEYVNWILSAKREETRFARLEKTIDMLKRKKKNPTDKS
jgi:hypothetical protein